MFECGWPHSLGLETSLLEQGCNPVAEEYFKTMDIDKSGKVTYVACSRMECCLHIRDIERGEFSPSLQQRKSSSQACLVDRKMQAT